MGRVVVSVTVGLDIMDDNVGKYIGDSTAGIGFVLAVPPGAVRLWLLQVVLLGLLTLLTV